MENMKPLWVIIGVCSCWLAFMVPPQQCTMLSKETTEITANSINNVTDNHHFTSLLSSVVSQVDTSSEPKVHITGFNGLCVTVPNGDYRNGNGLVLDECKEGQENQLWTLRSSDQTIRSGGKCMTTYGYKSGHYVMIYDCRTAVNAATKWQIHSNFRRIINPISGLFLTAQKDSKGVYNLIVEYNHYVPRQAWVPTNNTKPPVNRIIGFGSLCLTLNGVEKVEMVKCDQNVAEQKWAVYLDGTIRPKQHQGRCLRFEYGQYVVSVGTCGGWTNEPWIFQKDGTILHLATGKVMDIKSGCRSCRSNLAPFLNCYDGSVSQIWSMSMTTP